MKVNVLERLCKKFGGWYEYEYSTDGRYIFITWHTIKHALFEDELKSIRTTLNKNKFRLQYISYKSDGIVLEIINS